MLLLHIKSDYTETGTNQETSIPLLLSFASDLKMSVNDGLPKALPRCTGQQALLSLGTLPSSSPRLSRSKMKQNQPSGFSQEVPLLLTPCLDPRATPAGLQFGSIPGRTHLSTVTRVRITVSDEQKQFPNFDLFLTNSLPSPDHTTQHFPKHSQERLNKTASQK